jgi:hypothetical protein
MSLKDAQIVVSGPLIDYLATTGFRRSCASVPRDTECQQAGGLTHRLPCLKSMKYSEVRLTPRRVVTQYSGSGGYSVMPPKLRSAIPTQLMTLACPHCKAVNVLKAQKTLDFSQVASYNVQCVRCQKTWNEVLPGPICEGPFAKVQVAGKLTRRRLVQHTGH